jgi:hypothetical protein
MYNKVKGCPAGYITVYVIRYYPTFLNSVKVLSLVLVTCRRGFGLVNRFIEYSQVVTTINYNTLKITVTITHEIMPSASVCCISA